MSRKYVLNWGGKGGGIVSRDKRLGGQLQFFFLFNCSIDIVKKN